MYSSVSSFIVSLQSGILLTMISPPISSWSLAPYFIVVKVPTHLNNVFERHHTDRTVIFAWIGGDEQNVTSSRLEAD